MKRFPCVVLVATLAAATVLAESGDGKRFGARDPRTCSSKKDPVHGAPTAAQVKQNFICENEKLTRSGSAGDLLYLVSDVNVEIGKGRPFNPLTDSFQNIDPSQMVYPIRGGYVSWQCAVVGTINGAAGKNCSRNDAPQVAGSCYKDAFGDWHCNMCCTMGSSAKMGYAPPTGQ